MAFISNCPKCQKSVLVPDGHGHDAVVQCPACFVEYPLGEILAAGPPALIVVHPGSAAVAAASSSAADGIHLAEPAMAGAAGAAEGTFFAAHHIEPSLHDADAIQFADDGHDVHPAHEAEEIAADSIFGAGDAIAMEEHPSEHFGEPASVPFAEDGVNPFAEPEATALDAEGHELAKAPGEEGDSWGGNWGGFSDEAAPAEGEEGAVALDDPEAMESVNFADITGKAAPGAGAVEGAAVTVEPPKKKKRKREANPLLRLVGVVVSGLLAVPVVLGFAMWRGMQLDFLPTWLQFNKKPAAQSSGPKPPTTQNTPPANAGEPAANATPTATADAAGPGAPAISNSASVVGSNPTAPASPTPDAPKPDAPKPDVADNKPPAQPGITGTEVATNDKPGPKPKAAGKEDAADAGDPFNSPTAPPDEPKPPVVPPEKTDVAPPAVAPVGGAPKTETPNPAPAKPDAGDPFAGPTPTAPSGDKPKTEPKPDAPAPAKPDAGDPFAGPTPTVPSGDKPKTEPKPETPTKPDAGDPFAGPIPTPPSGDKPKTEPKPDVPAPVKPETPSKPDAADPFAKPAELKPDTPAPKLEAPTPVKPDVPMPEPVKPEPVKPEPKVETKPAVGPLNAETFSATDVDGAVKAAAASGGADAKSYTAWCKLAEVATFAQGETAAQKQTVLEQINKVAANPQAAGSIAAAAKALLDAKATSGGIVLAGKVSKIASRNGLFGTAIRMDGMPNAVMVFSANALDIKEGQSVLVLGALVSDPQKNLPGYTGKQPVIVWSEFAAPAP